jgi:predicted lipoprotein with Yx(FWY)xxD motif/plastocyanin
MVNFRSVAAVFIVLTVIFAGAAGYFATNPPTVVSTVTSTQSGAVITSTQTSTVTNVITQTATSTVSSGSATAPFSVKLAYKLGVGFYMTNGSGWTLYAYKRDNQSTATSACVGGCITSWPAFYAASLKVPTDLNASGFTTVSRSDGIKQLAYNGWPLYYYAKDKAPGDTVGQAVGNVWFACCSLAAATTTSSTTTSTSTTTTTSPTPAGAVRVSILNGAGVNQASPGYSPASLTLVVGINATVIWTNNDSTSHTVTSNAYPAGAQSYRSGNMSPGATYSTTFTVPGTYTYFCDYHGWMTGTIVVK